MQVSSFLSPRLNYQSSRLLDLWQSEEQLAWRIDAWLISSLPEFPMIGQDEVRNARRFYTRARQALKQRISDLGRAVVRVPFVFVASEETAANLSQAVRELQALHHELIRARDQTEAALFIARRDRDYATLGVLKQLQKAHQQLIFLVRRIFDLGQRANRQKATEVA